MSKADPLLGCKAKIERAIHHVGDLRKSVASFRDGSRDLFTRDSDPESVKHQFRAQTPLEWSLIVGDCIHNLRIALEYVLVEAIHLEGNATTPYTGFPIGETRKKFEDSFGGKVNGTSEKVRRLLQRLKPYQGGNESFWIIHSLDISDKHEAIIPVWAELKDVGVLRVLNGSYTQLAQGWSGTIRPVDSTEVVEVHDAVVDTENTDSYYKVKSTFDLVFPKGVVVEGWPVVPTLESLIQFTQRIVEIFDRHIFR